VALGCVAHAYETSHADFPAPMTRVCLSFWTMDEKCWGKEAEWMICGVKEGWVGYVGSLGLFVFPDAMISLGVEIVYDGVSVGRFDVQ
jgi:hypothetical protein